MRKLVEKLRPASGAASIVSNPFPPPRRSLSPRGPPSPPPPSPSPLKTWPSWRTSRGLFRQLAPADMCQPCVRVCVCVCVCARPGDPFFPSSKPTTLRPLLLSADHVLARRFHGRENQSVRDDTRFPWEDRTRDVHVNALSRLTWCGGGFGSAWNRVKFTSSGVMDIIGRWKK